MSFTAEYEDEEISHELGKATDALETLYVLKTVDEAAKEREYTISEEKIVNVALESFFTKYSEMRPALEEIDDGRPATTTGDRIKKTIDYLFSLARQILTFFLDYIRNNKHRAKMYMNLTKELIGRADGLPFADARVEVRTIINALHVNGGQPTDMLPVLSGLFTATAKVRKQNSLHELTITINQAKAGDLEKTRDDVETVRAVHERAMASVMNAVSNPQRSFAFNASRTDCDYYLSPEYFGGMHVAGFISSETRNDGSILLECDVKRNPERIPRVSFFNALEPIQVRDICRLVQSFCREVVNTSVDEAALSRLLREATFIAGTNADLTTVLALRSLATTSKGAYSAYMKLSMRTCKAVLKWCAASVGIHEKEGVLA